MSVEVFDLGLRLRAAADRRVAPLLKHAPVMPAPHPVAVRATATTRSVTVTACEPGGAARTATGRAALELLGGLGVSMAADSPAQLVTESRATWAALGQLAKGAPRTGDLAAVGAQLAWAVDQRDFPDSRAGYVLPEACRTRWVTGSAPVADGRVETWRQWLGFGDGVAGLLDAHQMVTAGVPLPMLAGMVESAMFSWVTAQNRHASGFDWRLPDTPGRAALGLRDRCNAAELWAAALMDDPVWRLRAVHTGHVAYGQLVPAADNAASRRQRATLVCDRLDFRLSADTACTGWFGGPQADAMHHSVTLAGTAVEAGQLHLFLTLGRNVTLRSGGFTLREAAPNRRFMNRARRDYRDLYALRRSWLTTGRAPIITRREVPLDVLVAGAEPDEVK